MNLNNFLHSNFTFSNDEYEIKLQYILYNSILSIVSVMLTGLGLIRLYQENYIQAFTDLIFVLISLYALFYIKKSKRNTQKTIPLLLGIFFLLVSISFINTNMDIVGASWFIVLLLPTFYLGGIKYGIFITIASFFAVIISGELREKEYQIFDYFYILIPMVMASVFIYLYEKRVNFAKELLVLKNISLQNEVKEKSAEEEFLLQHNKELADVVNKSNIELYIVDYETDQYLYVNQGGVNAIGYSLEELLTMSVYDTNPTLTIEMVQKLKEIGKTTKNIMNITQHKRKDGSRYGVQSLIHSITYNNREAYVIYDINLNDQQVAQNQLLAQKEELLKQAHYDNLTKLPNRVLFSDRLKQAMAKANRSKKDFAIIFIDLDKFKEINDTYGHKMGDSVLCEVASRFKHTLREEDTISRFGGDEFVCIIEQLDACDKISALATKLINIIKEPIVISEHQLYLTCSLGISIYNKDASSETELLHHADTAMYRAKDMGKDNYQFYSPC